MTVKNTFRLNWKRWTAIGASAGAAIAVLLVLIVGERSNTKIAQQLLLIGRRSQILPIQVKAHLKTQWSGGLLHYVFKVAPISLDYVNSFDERTRDLQNISFVVSNSLTKPDFDFATSP